MEFHPIDRFMKWISLDRLGTLNAHYESLRVQVAPKNPKEEQELEFFSREFENYHHKAATLGKVRFILYIFLYAAVAVNVLKLIPLLRFLVGFVELGSALIGTGIAFVFVFLLTARINLHMQRMQQCLYHLTVLYQMNPKRDTKSTLASLRKVI